MSSNRSFVCLICGETCIVNADEYKIIKEHPICADCKEKLAAEEEKKTPTNNEPKFDDVIGSVAGAIGTIGTYINKNIIKPIISSQNNTTGSKTKGFANVLKTEFAHDEHSWQHIGCLGELYDKGKLGKWSDYVGLYMHKINGEIMYIGRAIEYNNGGFRKRLSDYCRPNGSARVHPSGQKIHANRYKIQTYLLIVGSDEAAAEETKKLEEYYVGKYNPPWNDKLKSDK